MAFDPRELAILAYANGFTLWHYATEDGLQTVKATGYFNEASMLVQPGDWVFANAGRQAATLVVTQIADGKVAVAPLAA